MCAGMTDSLEFMVLSGQAHGKQGGGSRRSSGTAPGEEQLASPELLQSRLRSKDGNRSSEEFNLRRAKIYVIELACIRG